MPRPVAKVFQPLNVWPLFVMPPGAAAIVCALPPDVYVADDGTVEEPPFELYVIG